MVIVNAFECTIYLTIGDIQISGGVKWGYLNTHGDIERFPEDFMFELDMEEMNKE